MNNKRVTISTIEEIKDSVKLEYNNITAIIPEVMLDKILKEKYIDTRKGSKTGVYWTPTIKQSIKPDSVFLLSFNTGDTKELKVSDIDPANINKSDFSLELSAALADLDAYGILSKTPVSIIYTLVMCATQGKNMKGADIMDWLNSVCSTVYDYVNGSSQLTEWEKDEVMEGVATAVDNSLYYTVIER